MAGALLGSINIARGPDAPVFRRDDAARLDLIARHASIALARAQREQELDRRCTIFEASLDVLDLPFVLTAPDRTIIFANRAAWAVEFTSRFSDSIGKTADMLAPGQCRVATLVIQSGDRTDCQRLAVRSISLDGADAIMSFLYMAPDETASALPVLTRREREIADFVMRGFSNVDIALAASVSRNTVKQHLKHVFEKLQVSSRSELAAAVARAESGSPSRGRLKRLPAMPFPDDREAGRSSGEAAPSRSRRRL